MTDTIVKLRSNIGGQWVIVAPKGHTLYELPPSCSTREQAYDEANAWASSWSSMVVRFEDEQDKKRD